MKKNIVYICGIVVAIVALGILYKFITDRDEWRKNAPIIAKESELKETNVGRISFERNGLFINDKEYRAGGISGYSRVLGRDGVFKLDEIEPPFILRKKGNNDTLELVKDDRSYFMNVTVEQEWAKQ